MTTSPDKSGLLIYADLTEKRQSELTREFRGWCIDNASMAIDEIWGDGCAFSAWCNDQEDKYWASWLSTHLTDADRREAKALLEAMAEMIGH